MHPPLSRWGLLRLTALTLLLLIIFSRHLRAANATSLRCEPLQHSLGKLKAIAVNNTLLVTAVDKHLWDFFGTTWVENARGAGITYGLIAAVGDEAAKAISAAGYGDRCILAPTPHDPASSSAPGAESYQWQSTRWRAATWAKVRTVAALTELSYDVVHSDIDATWVKDPWVGILADLHAALAAAAAATTRGVDIGGGHGDPASTGAWLRPLSGQAPPPPPPVPDVLFSTDMLTTTNADSYGMDSGLEEACSPFVDLNTGVYWVRGSSPGGKRIMRGWLAMKHAGYQADDQTALNILVRGTAAVLDALPLPRGYDRSRTAGSGKYSATTDADPPPPVGVPRFVGRWRRAAAEGARQRPQRDGSGGFVAGEEARKTLLQRQRAAVFGAAGAPGIAGGGEEAAGAKVGCLPVSSFSHSYAFLTTRLHEVRNHPLYEVHWVWGGRTLESKRQAMRGAGLFYDPPAYYRPERLMTMELRHAELPDGYNSWPPSRTEDMVRFSLDALNAQLQQLYWGLALAMALNRTLVLPEFRCYCARNWYATTACRISNERLTSFPFTCPFSQVLRAKRLLSDRELRLQDPQLPGPVGLRVADVREHSFLTNPRTPPKLKSAPRLVVRAAGASAGADPAGASPSGGDPGGKASLVVELDGPKTDRQLQELLRAPPHDAVRILHVPDPGAVLSGFADAFMWSQYDKAVQRIAATWCCRSKSDIAKAAAAAAAAAAAHSNSGTALAGPSGGAGGNSTHGGIARGGRREVLQILPAVRLGRT